MNLVATHWIGIFMLVVSFIGLGISFRPNSRRTDSLVTAFGSMALAFGSIVLWNMNPMVP